MVILALDTTGEMGGVGVFRAGQSLASVSNTGPANRYSITLFEMVEQALKESRLGLANIDLFAAANGPGSFTGIRVGLAAAKAWGKAIGRPVRGVSVLEALVKSAGPKTECAFPILDARRGECFFGIFHRLPGQSEGSAPPDFKPADDGWVLKPDSLRAIIEKQISETATGTCIVRAHDQVAADLRSSLPTSLKWERVEGSLVRTIAEIAAWEEPAGGPAGSAKLDAYYIRRPDAEINWRD